MRILPRRLISQRDGWESYSSPACFSQSSSAEDHRVHRRRYVHRKWATSNCSELGCTLWSAVTLRSECHDDFADHKSYTKQRMMHDEVDLYTHDIGIQTKRTTRLMYLLESLSAHRLALL